MDSFYTLSNSDYTIKVSPEFVFSCNVFTNMFEDTGISDNTEPILITTKFSKEELRMYVKFFEDMSSLKVKNNSGSELSYLDYIINFKEEYVENYLNKNENAPHTDRVYEIFSEIEEENFVKIIDIDQYYDNKKIISGIMLCFAIYTRKLYNDCYKKFNNCDDDIYSDKLEILKSYIDSLI